MKPRASLSTAHRALPRRQRGYVTLLAVFVLIMVIVVAMTQSLSASNNSALETRYRGESERALFVAESGLEAAQSRLTTLLGGAFTHATCTGLTAAFNNVTLGDGRYSIVATSTPDICNNADPVIANRCQACSLTATGRVGAAKREVFFGVGLSSTNGTSCNATAGQNCTNASAPPPDWKLNLSNNNPTAAIAVFNLAAKRRGNQSAATCTASACRLAWNVNSANGNASVTSMGNAVILGPGDVWQIYQQLNASFDLAQVGALFAGTNAALTGPAVAGGASYWEQPNSGSGGTLGKTADSSGSTNNGTLTPSPSACTPDTANATQTCTNWCYGGDTLVYGFSADANDINQSLSSVTFGNETLSGRAMGAQAAMTRVARYPSATIAGAPTTVYSEIWYAQNPDYLSNATASAGAQVTAALGSTFTGNLSNNSNQVVISSLSTGTRIFVGDVLTCTGGGTCPAMFSPGPVTIIAQVSGPAGQAGTYRMSATCAIPFCGSRSMRTNSVQLIVTTIPAGSEITVGDVLARPAAPATALATFNTGGNAVGAFTLNTAGFYVQQTMLAQSLVVRVTGGTVPSSGIPAADTLLKVRGGTGRLDGATRVAAAPAPTATRFTLDKPTFTPLAGATLCGGTCAFFDHTAANTPYSIVKSAGSNYWASGFICMKNVTPPEVVNSSQTTKKAWAETVFR